LTANVVLPEGTVVRAGGVLDQPKARRPDWGVYADECWHGWPGTVLDWPDLGLPADHTTAISAITQGFARARHGQDVLIGCRGGSGRTGTILACLAILAGVPADLAVQWVRDRYRPESMETSAQVDWVINRFAQVDRVRREAARSRQRFVKAAFERLRAAMWKALQQPERSPVLAWAVTDVLAITQRPAPYTPCLWRKRSELPGRGAPCD